MSKIFNVLEIWATIWFNNNILKLRQEHTLLQNSKDGLIKELLLLAYEKRLYQLLQKSMKNNNLKDWQ